MEAGRLDRRVQLYRPVVTRDAMNAPVPDFVADGGLLPAKRNDVSDAQRFQAQQAGAVLGSRFQVRRTAQTDQVDPTWQLADGAERFQITAKKRLLAHGEFGRQVGYEFSCVASAETTPPIDDDQARA